MKKICVFVLLVILGVCFTGCATTTSSKHLRKISLGMTKDEVVKALGEPTVSRGSIKNKYNQVIEVWEYALALPSDDSVGEVIGKSCTTVITLGMGAVLFKEQRKDYWLYFLDNDLVQWGEAGDWSKEPERIYEFNFNPSPSLTK